MRFLLAIAALGVAATDATYVVTTKSGPVIGDANDYAVYWKGIPYATPPTGSNRWQPPKPAQPWTDPRNASKWGPGCPQDCHGPGMTCPKTTSEDCLSLNVFIPKGANPGTPLPVLVWFHGGQFEFGAANLDLYDGSVLAQAGNVVVVTVNYRLGALGFLYVKKSDITGSYGFLDQQLSLAWVQENIRFFSGDPSKVTIFGESAGAASVAAHLTAPSSWPYFHQAILQSNPFGLRSVDVDSTQGLADAFTKKLGCAVGNAACLRKKSVSEILKAQEETSHALDYRKPLAAFLPWTPVVDKRLIPEQPLTALREGRTRPKTPILAGHTLNETTIFVHALKAGMPDKKFTPFYVNLVLGYIVTPLNAFKLRSHYGIGKWKCSDCLDETAAIGDHFIFKCPQRWAFNGTKFASRGRTYTYRFDHILSFNDAAWGKNFKHCYNAVCHGQELAFVFGAPIIHGKQFNITLTKSEVDLTAEVMRDWSTFAATGAPTFAKFDSEQRGYYWRYGTKEDAKGKSSGLPRADANHCDFWNGIGYLRGFGSGPESSVKGLEDGSLGKIDVAAHSLW